MSLYKRLELQSAIGLLDSPMGELGAAPSLLPLQYVRRVRKTLVCSAKTNLSAGVHQLNASYVDNNKRTFPPPASDERKEATRPKKKFLAADVRKMHHILSKNMYNIRQKVADACRETHVLHHFGLFGLCNVFQCSSFFGSCIILNETKRETLYIKYALIPLFDKHNPLK